jgi:hypothetical protein
MHDEYHDNEADIQTIIRHLKATDPKNANRDYATQYLESMKGFGSELARSDESLAEALKKKLDDENKNKQN